MISGIHGCVVVADGALSLNVVTYNTTSQVLQLGILLANGLVTVLAME